MLKGVVLYENLEQKDKRKTTYHQKDNPANHTICTILSSNKAIDKQNFAKKNLVKTQDFTTAELRFDEFSSPRYNKCVYLDL